MTTLPPPRIPLLATLAALAALAGAAAPPALAQARLDDTGVAECIDGAGQIAPCGGTGQDAEFGRDVSQPAGRDGRLGLRYTRICRSGEAAGEGSCPAVPPQGSGADDWGCTRDDNTGLTWELKTTDGGLHDAQRNFTFYTPTYDPDGQYGGPGDATGFVAAVNAAGLCGANDWRLPTPSELMGLVDMGLITLPPVDLRFLPNTVSSLHWGAGTVRNGAFKKQLAWGSDFSFGMGSISAQFRSDQRPVRLVRGGPAPSPRFTPVAAGRQVADRLTGLAWRRCLEGQQWDGSGCAGEALRLDWFEALTRAQAQADRSGQGWRLPNQKELASLLDHERASHIDTRAFPPQQADSLWTSSPLLIYRLPRCVSFINGTTSICNAGIPLGVRLVRDLR